MGRCSCRLERERERASTYIILQVFFWEEEALDCEGDEVSALFWPVAIIILVKKKALERREDCLYVVCMSFDQQILVKDADKRASSCYHGRNAPTMNGDGVLENYIKSATIRSRTTKHNTPKIKIVR